MAAVATDVDGYTELFGLAERRGGLRGWGNRGTGGYGAGPAHHLEDGYGYVMTFDNQLAHFGKPNAQINDLGIRPWN